MHSKGNEISGYAYLFWKQNNRKIILYPAINKLKPLKHNINFITLSSGFQSHLQITLEDKPAGPDVGVSQKNEDSVLTLQQSPSTEEPLKIPVH